MLKCYTGTQLRTRRTPDANHLVASRRDYPFPAVDTAQEVRIAGQETQEWELHSVAAGPIRDEILFEPEGGIPVPMGEILPFHNYRLALESVISVTRAVRGVSYAEFLGWKLSDEAVPLEGISTAEAVAGRTGEEQRLNPRGTIHRE